MPWNRLPTSAIYESKDNEPYCSFNVPNKQQNKLGVEVSQMYRQNVWLLYLFIFFSLPSQYFRLMFASGQAMAYYLFYIIVATSGS